MQGIVFVPGISGSELIFKSETPPIWPPNWWDIFGYEEMKELLDPKHVSVGNVIDNVLDVIPIYGTTEEDLRSIKPSYAPGEIIHAQIIPDEEANFISGSLMLSRLAADTGRSFVSRCNSVGGPCHI